MQKHQVIRKTAIVAALAALALTSTACNTVRGLGEDLESVANEVDKEI
jgi:predicted small secreted protein